jgi:hypothetical protein
MALTAAQIVTLACQIAKSDGFTSQAGQMLNAILSDLCQAYDLDVTRQVDTFSFSVPTQSGPYVLTGDYLRANPEDVFYVIDGVPYMMISITLAEYDQLVQQAGLASYPTFYATDVSQSPTQMFVWPPPAGSYPVTVRYYRQMPDITTPETSSTVPWFPNQQYLITRLAGELCMLSDDERYAMLLGDGPQGAVGILRSYLQMKDDKTQRASNVKLDRRRFGRSFNRLPNTKTIGW